MVRKKATNNKEEELATKILCEPSPWSSDNFFSEHYKRFKKPYIRGSFPNGVTVPTYLDVYNKWVFARADICNQI